MLHFLDTFPSRAEFLHLQPGAGWLDGDGGCWKGELGGDWSEPDRDTLLLAAAEEWVFVS